MFAPSCRAHIPSGYSLVLRAGSASPTTLLAGEGRFEPTIRPSEPAPRCAESLAYFSRTARGFRLSPIQILQRDHRGAQPNHRVHPPDKFVRGQIRSWNVAGRRSCAGVAGGGLCRDAPDRSARVLELELVAGQWRPGRPPVDTRVQQDRPDGSSRPSVTAITMRADPADRRFANGIQIGAQLHVFQGERYCGEREYDGLRYASTFLSSTT